MLTVDQHQLDALSKARLEQYVNSLVGRLKSRHDVTLPEDQIKGSVIRAIHEAGSLGFARECDVTPFVLLAVTLGPNLEKSPLGGWLSAVMNKVESPATSRMDAVHALLPDADRMLYFRD